MRLYEFTPRGEEIAEASGLQELASKLHERDYEDVLLDLLTNRGMYLDEDERDIVKARAITKAAGILHGRVDATVLCRGLDVKDTASWRIVDGQAQGTLFPIESLTDFAPTMWPDRFVLSGVAAAVLANYRNQCQLLTKKGFEAFGFKTRTDAYALVGAYVLNYLSDVRLLRDETPSFEMDGDTMRHVVEIGGDIHGDFRMKLINRPMTTAIAPTGRSVEFVPHTGVRVSGYHSVEPYITTAMLQHEMRMQGLEPAARLADELLQVADDMGGINMDYTIGNFGDYGDGNVSEVLSEIRFDIDEKRNGYELDATLHVSGASPGSGLRFEVVSQASGLVLQNRYSAQETAETSIAIPRDKFKDLFGALIGQASAGLGRTSHDQHIRLLTKAQETLRQTA